MGVPTGLLAGLLKGLLARLLKGCRPGAGGALAMLGSRAGISM